MGPGYWLITKNGKTTIKENKLEACTVVARDLFMCNILAREALLSTLPKNEYSRVKSLNTSSKIWKTLESTFEGDKHAMRVRL